ncbi:MAG TPA: RMD1 family protein [Alphaproteobacteria bacterium]|nr:RMD1 family protein [Alphaproteobacteria bacterium]
MRCLAICNAETFDLHGLALALEDVEFINFYTDALHAAYKESNIFIFSYGCVALWNVDIDEEKRFLEILRKFTRDPINTVSEEFEYTFASKPRFFQDKITLAKTRSHALQMLAVSYGLSQTIKLSAFEDRIDNTIEMTKNIPQELAIRGKMSLSRKDISKRIGELFIERNSVNLHSDILDAPVFIWDHPEYETLYTLTINDLELHARTAVLNRRLDIVKELFEMMRDELNNRHSTMLELIIIILIMIEVFLTLFIHVFHLV